ncbi:hypothetical protein D1872_269450 [compost metagenome]
MPAFHAVNRPCMIYCRKNSPIIRRIQSRQYSRNRIPELFMRIMLFPFMPLFVLLSMLLLIMQSFHQSMGSCKAVAYMKSQRLSHMSPNDDFPRLPV